eukprot:TRINITY_DN79470_c0_g1_i1.p1 TRINITY_DN79470_c0_g1~~TRINITY_DN79470_c0_g1_i1.p1  ORF type:complete len:150 (-),score=24.18 TRINITY_DN79470_c0_g1_i1:14-463(-)
MEVPSNIVYRTDFDKYVVVSNFERRGWLRSSNNQDWNIYWASVVNLRQLFDPSSSRRLRQYQLVNHFPNHYELTRKDLMWRNIRRYHRDKSKQELLAEQNQQRQHPSSTASAAAAAVNEDPLPEEWVPSTYMLPNDYALFGEGFRKNSI